MSENSASNIPVFIINLEKDTDRKKHMENLCNLYGIKPSFIHAVYGNELSDKEIKDIIDNEKAIRYIKRPLTNGELGCLLSHKRIYKKIIEENINIALIMEDDVLFDNNLLDFLNYLDNLPKNFDVILLGHHTPTSRSIPTKTNLWYKKRIACKFVLKKPAELACGTYGYLVSNQGAKKLYNMLEKIFLPIDHYTGNYRFVNVYLLDPPIIHIYEKLSECSTIDKVGNRNILGNCNKNFGKSLKRKIAENLGIYKVLKSIKDKLSDIYIRIKLVRFYK